MVTVKEKYFKTKYRPVGTLLNFFAVIYFIFNLKLKFRKNKNYCTVIVNLHTGFSSRKFIRHTNNTCSNIL
jgi:riboflavin transporter FmnP